MYTKKMLCEAENLKDEIIRYRRTIHRLADVGFDVCKTTGFIKNELKNIGIDAATCGRAGVVAELGQKNPEKVFLLRADIDALTIKEDSGTEFSAQNGNMHACGHDMHAAMLLGAARILKRYENEINGRIKLMFQPAEELLEGAEDMIRAGVLDNPSVDAAMMVHVMTGVKIQTGTLIVSSAGESAPSADYFTITVKGAGCHGAMPNTGRDPIIAAAHILTALGELSSRELAMNDKAVITVGSITAGDSANVIPDTAVMRGSMRAFGTDVRDYLKKRLREISVTVGAAFRTEVELSFDAGCPPLKNDSALSSLIGGYLKELVGCSGVLFSNELDGDGKRVAGSEDFAYVSQKVPSVMLAIAAGEPDNGFSYPLHHPKVTFDESVLPLGAAAYAYSAMRWLYEKNT